MTQSWEGKKHAFQKVPRSLKSTTHSLDARAPFGNGERNLQSAAEAVGRRN